MWTASHDRGRKRIQRPSQVPAGQVGRIEVYRGSSPGSFGSGAIGGIVNITTVPSDSSTGVESSASYGSFNTAHQALTARFGSARQPLCLRSRKKYERQRFSLFQQPGHDLRRQRRPMGDSKEQRLRIGKSAGEMESVRGRASGCLGHGVVHGFRARRFRPGNQTGVEVADCFDNAPLAGSSPLSRSGRHPVVWLMREKMGFHDPLDEARTPGTSGYGR